jgi:hypothetical protein
MIRNFNEIKQRGMKLQNKKKLIKERTQNKRICNHKNDDKIQQKKELKSNG